MEQGQFCFIKDEFFDKYDNERKLMRNDESVIDADGNKRGRPCFYAFKDKKNPMILWCVPISSRVEKYKRIYNQKLDRQRERGTKAPKCNTIRFGEVMGVEKAFLIQNMFPIIEKYIGDIYINRLTQKAVRIPQHIEQDIIFHAGEVLRLVRSGNKNLVFSDILATFGNLNSELKQIEIPAPSQPEPYQEAKVKETLHAALERNKARVQCDDIDREKQGTLGKQSPEK